MSIPDPTIDPITGLPVLNPQDVIQQIPLGVQTFPYEDMQATARPTRNPLYGDDILPVSAFVAGQHPSTGSAQTVGTDGNHRLLVSSDGGSGGGPLPQNIQGPSGSSSQVLPAGDQTEVVTVPSGGTAGIALTGVYGFVVCPAASVSFATDLIIQYTVAHDGYAAVNGFVVLQAITAAFYGVWWSEQFTVPILFSRLTDTAHGYIQVGVGGDMIGTMGLTWYDVGA